MFRLEPDIIVRRHAVLMLMDPIRAIIMTDRVLLVVPEDSESIIRSLELHFNGKFNRFDELSEEFVHLNEFMYDSFQSIGRVRSGQVRGSNILFESFAK